MTSTYYLSRANDAIHKYKVTTPQGRTIKFGASGYGDYINYYKNNPKIAKIKKAAYIARHSVRESFSSVNSKSTWARYILWNKPTLVESKKSMERRFRIKIILH